MAITSLLHLAQDNPKLKAAIFRAEAKSEEACKRRTHLGPPRDSSQVFKVHPDFHNSSELSESPGSDIKHLFFHEPPERFANTIDRERILASPQDLYHPSRSRLKGRERFSAPGPDA